MSTVKIGHASNPDSQAAKQVLISDYYSGNWTVVLRPRTRAIAEKSAAICEAVCNNNNVRYSQGSRNTLRKAALDAAGLSDSDNNLNKLTVADIDAISNICYADCSSLMTFCAIAGGARITYGSNAATTSTMRLRFTKYGDYTVYLDKVYTDSSQYLQRGDILVGGGHTVMILDDGSDAVVVAETEDERLDITTIKLEATLLDINSTSIVASLHVYKLNVGAEESLTDVEELKAYEWSYSICSLTDSEELTSNIKYKSVLDKITIAGLKPNSVYTLKITAVATSEKTNLSSASVIFTTKPTYPKAVTDLKIKFADTFYTNKSFSISFNSTSYTNVDNSLHPCYRLFLFVNGRAVAYTDSLLSFGKSYTNKAIKMSQLTSKDNLFTYGDVVQIGVQPGLTDSTEKKFICDKKELRCSQPILIKNAIKTIDKIYLGIADAVKRVLVYKK